MDLDLRSAAREWHSHQCEKTLNTYLTALDRSGYDYRLLLDPLAKQIADILANFCINENYFYVNENLSPLYKRELQTRVRSKIEYFFKVLGSYTKPPTLDLLNKRGLVIFYAINTEDVANMFAHEVDTFFRSFLKEKLHELYPESPLGAPLGLTNFDYRTGAASSYFNIGGDLWALYFQPKNDFSFSFWRAILP
ncbi:hypothetical protein C4588_03615 [Candidatus Parcubacteria bacterium]|nr:MAG: hypothetical protein C4588_03615 [Candidatus Parcubacteria bacterium]